MLINIATLNCVGWLIVGLSHRQLRQRSVFLRKARPYYPNLVILPVDNNEHQRIDDVSTDRISYDIRSVETMGFAL